MNVTRQHRSYRDRRAALMRKWAAEGRRCHIDGCVIDYRAPANAPNAPELDHIIPISQGGSVLDPNNAAPAASRCNRSRGAKDLATHQQQAETTGRAPTRRTTYWGTMQPPSTITKVPPMKW